MNEKELFENLCFLPDWTECNSQQPFGQLHPDIEGIQDSCSQKKDLSTLLAELEGIKNNIENIKAREWHLAKLMKFHKEGLSFR